MTCTNLIDIKNLILIKKIEFEHILVWGSKMGPDEEKLLYILMTKSIG